MKPKNAKVSYPVNRQQDSGKPVISTGTSTSSSTGYEPCIRYQRCGGGRRIIRKKLGGD